MKRIICIGECALNIIFDGSTPVESRPGGRIINAAAIMAQKGLPVVMASEAAVDPIGDMLVDFLGNAGVDTSSVDRFTQGRTPLMIYTRRTDGSYELTRYEDYSSDGGFDIVWPRVDDTDIIVFGGYYVLDQRMRQRMVPFLNHCAERKAVMIYVPGFAKQMAPRITRVMPEILENLELADIVVTQTSDLRHIFGKEDPARCYRDHIDFYCRSLINLSDTNIEYFNGHESSAETTPTALSLADAVAGISKAVYELGLTPEQLDTTLEPDNRKKILLSAIS